MRLLFAGFLLIIFSFLALIIIFVMIQGNAEIEEIQSPPIFVFRNPFSEKLHEIKNQFILQKVLSETNIYGNSPFLLESINDFFNVKYYFDITKANYYLKKFEETYWWGNKRAYYLIFNGKVFYYFPHVVLNKAGEDNFGKVIFKALSGKSAILPEDVIKDKMKMLILQRYGVVIK